MAADQLTPEETKARNARYYQAHAKEQRAQAVAYRRANPEKIRSANAKWSAEHQAEKREYNLRYREEHAEELREYYRSPERKQALKASGQQYAANASNRMKILIRGASVRARQLGLEFDGLHELKGAFPEACACCFRSLDYSRKNRNRSPSLDRHDATLGYLSHNVRVICYRCNRLKSDATIADVEAILSYMRI